MIISNSAFLSSERFGLTTNFPSIFATLTSEMGPSNGISEQVIAVEAAKPASASGIVSASPEIRLMMTCVSFRYVSGNNGRMVRSTILDTSIS